MACFLAPVAEAIIVTVVTKAVATKEKNAVQANIKNAEVFEQNTRVPFSRKLRWLSNLLWGGSALLAFEHVWHGEVVAWFPFLTAASNAKDAAAMLHEVATVGVTMAALVTFIWTVMVLVSDSMRKKALKAAAATK